MGKGSPDHHYKTLIIDLSDTTIDPNTMMVKSSDTPASKESYLSHCLQWREVTKT